MTETEAEMKTEPPPAQAAGQDGEAPDHEEDIEEQQGLLEGAQQPVVDRDLRQDDLNEDDEHGGQRHEMERRLCLGLQEL